MDFDVVLLAFQESYNLDKLISQLKNKKKIVINISSPATQGNASLPLAFLQDDLAVSIHANGRTDRQARALKDYLKRHTECLKDMTLLVVGTDHNLIDLEKREPFHLQSPQYEIVSEQLSLIAGIQEFFVLNTCNRIEVYAIASRNQNTIQFLTRILNFDHLKEDQYYIKYDTNAFSHLCLVMSGLLSQVPGESHVVQQLKKSIELAKTNKWAGGLTQQVFDNALFVSKNVRQITTPMMYHVEIEDLSTKYTHESANHIENKSILILGAGVVGQGLIDRVLLHKPEEIKIAYRTNKPDLSRYHGLNVSAHQFSELNLLLGQADTIFSAVTTNRFILHSAHAPYFKKHTTVLTIDLCVPRSIDHHLQEECKNLCIADIESIKKWYLNIITNLDSIKKVGLEEINKRIGRYEKILDKEWLQEQ
jgi:glutamyl-tRNA reductase